MIRFTKRQNDNIFKLVMFGLCLLIIISIISILQMPQAFRKGTEPQILQSESEMLERYNQLKDLDNETNEGLQNALKYLVEINAPCTGKQ